MKIEELAKNEKLKSMQGWFFGIGLTLLIVAIGMFPLATRNPAAMANSAFAPFREIGSMAWMVLPIGTIGVVFLAGAFLIGRRIKRDS